MIIMLDTNLLVPASLYPNGVCAKAYNKAVYDKNISLVVCTYSIEEFIKSCNKKFSDDMQKIQSFLLDVIINTELIKTPPESEKIPEEEKIRDIKDRPILRAAIAANVDVIITGDKDFLESGLTKPLSVSPSDFVNDKINTETIL